MNRLPQPPDGRASAPKPPLVRPSLDGTTAGGFTLMEVMIAMAILAIALVAVFHSQAQSVSMAAEARFLTTASLLAQSRMAEIEALEPRMMKTEEGDFGERFPDYRWRLEVGDTDIDRVKKVALNVTHQRLARNNTYAVVLYRLVSKP